MDELGYLMESDEETLRLDVKTDPSVVEKQALWAGIGSGMRIADLGCGSGKTTSVLQRLVQPGGTTVGVDISKERVEFARSHYESEGITFVCGDIRLPLSHLGTFDLVLVRFVLEYYRSNALDIIRNVSEIVKPGGVLCLIDLDHNCLTHFGLPERLERTITSVAQALQEKMNFDPYVGRKLYSYLYDTGYEDISVAVGAHNVIYGELNDTDAFNWIKKAEITSRKAGLDLVEYEGGDEELVKDFTQFFSNPRRFSYTPLVSALGRRAVSKAGG